MIVVTTENIAGYEVTEVLGSTFGVVVRARTGDRAYIREK